MKDMIRLFKEKLNAPERLLEILQENFSGFPLHLVVNQIKNNSKSKFNSHYSEKMKEFALTLYFYSPKAYKYLRNNNFSLPNQSTLRKWVSSFKCSPGFLEEVFLFLKKNVPNKPDLKQVNLVFDAMSIRKQIIYDHHQGKNYGYVDFGNNMKTEGPETLASEALVFQVVSLKGNFKSAVGYFFINSLSSEVLSKLVKMCIVKLYDVGVIVHNVTFDGTNVNVNAMKKLGCQFPEKPFFTLKLGNVSQKICVLLDACHMLKLARNTLADKKTITSIHGIVDFKYIQRLNTLQKEQGLNLANKLSDKHIFYNNRKMNVKIAAQTLSSGVADALEFLQNKNHPDFVGCGPTIKFIRVIDRLFDFLNSRDPYGKHFKGPINKNNLLKSIEQLEYCYDYLSQLKIEEILVLKHSRKTFALGFMSDINSIKILAERLLQQLDFKYILTYKFSQDHLELLFACIRSRGGYNNNPNVKQFQWALRKLMFRNSVEAPQGTNCISFDNNHQHSVMSFVESAALAENENDDENHLNDIENLKSLINNCQSSYYKDNVLYYLCGFIVRKIDAKLNCEECCRLLIDDNSNLSSYTHFTDFVSKGKLLRASSDVFKLVKFMHNHLLLCESKNNDLDVKRMILLACRIFGGNIFKGHLSNNDYSEDSHEIKLIKLIGHLFYKVMCCHHARNKTSNETFSKLGMRQKLNKLILFSNV